MGFRHLGAVLVGRTVPVGTDHVLRAVESNVLRKLQLSTRHELARWATEHRLV